MTQDQPTPEAQGATRLSRRRFLLALTGAASASLLAACGAPAAPAPTPPRAAATTAATAAPAAAPPPPATPLPTAVIEATAGASTGGTLVFAAESVGESLEPGLWNGFGSSNVLDNVYDKLTRPGINWSDPPRPGLAETWEISPDGKTYTFKLRQGVRFHDGTDLNADAVVRSLTRMTNPQDKSYVKGLYMNAEYGQSNWKSLTAVDDMTVQLVLKEPDAAQLYRLFHPAAAIMSAKAMDTYGAAVGTNPVGAGPFKLERFVAGQEVTLRAFENYWDGGRPPLDTVVVRGYADEGAMLAALESGEVNFAPYPPASAIQRLQNDTKFKVEPGPPLVTLFLGLNQLQKPMDNRDVRLAINYAINRQNLIDGVLYGLGELPSTLISPVELGFWEQGRKISTQDIDKAKAHMAKSGLPLPIDITFSFENNRFWPLMAELIKSDLEAVGFKIRLEKLEAGAYSNKVFTGETQLNMNQRSLWVPDPDNKVRLLHSSQGSAQFETGVAKTAWGQEISVLIDQGRSESDPAKRVAIYTTIQQKILEEMPYVTLAYYKKPLVIAKNVVVTPPSAVSSERIFLHKVAIAG
jgi:peptide/nickel transport system substrate-binding protein